MLGRWHPELSKNINITSHQNLPYVSKAQWLSTKVLMMGKQQRTQLEMKWKHHVIGVGNGRGWPTKSVKVFQWKWILYTSTKKDVSSIVLVWKKSNIALGCKFSESEEEKFSSQLMLHVIIAPMFYWLWSMSR